MSIQETIRNRRSVGRVSQDPIERSVIERLLEAATWAPSHHNTQPWSFVVLTGEGRGLLGEGYARVAETGLQELAADKLAEKLDKERHKAFRAPVVIVAICSPPDHPKAVLEEEIAAANTAVQNLLLAAHDEGLGAIWRSGAPMFHPLMKETFGLQPQEQIVGFIYLGKPAGPTPAAPERIGIAEKVRWVDGV